MIGDDEEVQRTRQSDRLSGAGAHFFAAGESESILRRQSGAAGIGVEGDLGVEMQVAPEDTRRVVPSRVG